VSSACSYQIALRAQSAPLTRLADPIEIYAAAIDTSDYAERLAASVRRSVPSIGDLLDIGAGRGRLGRELRVFSRRWTAVEPNPNMQARLARLDQPPRVIRCGWEAAELSTNGHDTVLAASMAAPLEVPDAFLTRCLAWTRRAVVWIVPAHRGPRGVVFAGCLPAEWHGEDETPGIEIALGRLPADRQPRVVTTTELTFSGVFADLDRLASYIADRLGWTQPDLRRPHMTAHLRSRATSRIPARNSTEIRGSRMGGIMTITRYHMIRISGALLSTTALASPAFAQANSTPSGSVNLGDVVVTATGRSEPTSHIAGTVQVIDRGQIDRSAAKSVTELLAENAVGFMTQWTSDQTQVVIRGGQSDGQGRDFKSEVLILINGHRSGTANISKLSLADVDHIEIVKGPSSVVYGSQNMGGVINIIMKNGLTAPGSLVEAATGSWELAQGRAQTGGVYKNWDYYFGASGGSQSSYSVPGNGTEANTQWQRRAATGSLGWQADENNHVNFNIRQDGIYDAGFRGSGWSIFDQNNRYNSSAEMNYDGKTSSGFMKWYWQLYAVQDADDLNEPNNLSTPRGELTSIDDNKRFQDLIGSRFQPRFNLWQGNDLLLGWDYEFEQLRSDRFTFGIAGPVPQLAPTDNNQHVNETAFYAEDAQTLFDRWTLRGGLRETLGATTLDQTPVVKLETSTHDYKALTYSLGSTYLITDWLSGRIGASTGFRAPTATEFGQNFTVASSGSVLFGNPNLLPENSQQVEAGLTATWPAAKFDVAVFENRINDRIITQVIGATPTGATIAMEENDPGAVVLDGVELQYKMDMLKLMSKKPDSWFWSVYGNAYYNFRMVDEGLVITLPTDTNNRPIRFYESQYTFNTRFGQQGLGPWRDWFVEITGIVNGRLWYNSEEHLNIPGQVANVTVFELKPYTVWNMRSELKVADNWTVWAKINNIFNLDYNPILIALYQTPCIGNLAWANGSCGNSMPGREIILGVTGRF
jgi:vitamin B12 transporter